MDPFPVKIFDVPSARGKIDTIQDVTKAGKHSSRSKDDSIGDEDRVLKPGKDASSITVIHFDDDNNRLEQGSLREKNSLPCDFASDLLEKGNKKKHYDPFGVEESIKNFKKFTVKIVRRCSDFLQRDFGKKNEEALADSRRYDRPWMEVDQAGFSGVDRCDSGNSMAVDGGFFPGLNEMDGATDTDSCSGDNEDASLAESFANDSDATELDDFDFTDEEEDVCFDTTTPWISTVNITELETGAANRNETECNCENDYCENATESQVEFYCRTKDEVNKDGADQYDISTLNMSEADDNEADEIRLEFLTELEEKYTQVSQLVFLTEDSKIQKQLIEIVRWILQTHQRLQY